MCRDTALSVALASRRHEYALGKGSTSRLHLDWYNIMILPFLSAEADIWRLYFNIDAMLKPSTV